MIFNEDVFLIVGDFLKYIYIYILSVSVRELFKLDSH